MKWIESSKQMPTKQGRYIVKRFGEPMIADARLFGNNQMTFVTPNGMAWKGWKDFVWLDESPTPALEGEKEWVSVENKMQKPICINGVSPNLCDSIRRNQGMQSCECLIYQQYLKTELNQEKGEVLAYHEKWIDLDFNPDGIRTGFIGGNGAFISAKWCDSGDTYENDEEFMPTHYKAKPLPPKTDNP